MSQLLQFLSIVAVIVIIYSGTNNVNPVQAAEEEVDDVAVTPNRTDDGYSEDALEVSIFRILDAAMDGNAISRATEIVSDDQKLCEIFVYVKSKSCVGRVQRLLINDEFAPFQSYMYNFNLNFTALMISIHDKFFKVARTPDDCSHLEDTAPMKDLLVKMKSFMNERAMKETFLNEIETNQFYVRMFRDINYPKAFKLLARVKTSPEYTMLMRRFYDLQFTFKTFAEAYIFPDLEAPIRTPVETPCEPPIF